MCEDLILSAKLIGFNWLKRTKPTQAELMAASSPLEMFVHMYTLYSVCTLCDVLVHRVFGGKVTNTIFTSVGHLEKGISFEFVSDSLPSVCVCVGKTRLVNIWGPRKMIYRDMCVYGHFSITRHNAVSVCVRFGELLRRHNSFTFLRVYTSQNTRYTDRPLCMQPKTKILWRSAASSPSPHGHTATSTSTSTSTSHFQRNVPPVVLATR